MTRVQLITKAMEQFYTIQESYSEAEKQAILAEDRLMAMLTPDQAEAFTRYREAAAALEEERLRVWSKLMEITGKAAEENV